MPAIRPMMMVLTMTAIAVVAVAAAVARRMVAHVNIGAAGSYTETKTPAGLGGDAYTQSPNQYGG